MDNSGTRETMGTQDSRWRQTKQKTQHNIKKPNTMSNANPTKNPRWTQVLAKGKQFQLRHPPHKQLLYKSEESLVDENWNFINIPINLK